MQGDGNEGYIRQEHLAPEIVFSCVFFSQVQCIADCLPQEHVAFSAHTQLSARPQQVVGLTIVFVWGRRVVVFRTSLKDD